MKCEICNKICFMGWKTEKQKQRLGFKCCGKYYCDDCFDNHKCGEEVKKHDKQKKA